MKGLNMTRTDKKIDEILGYLNNSASEDEINDIFILCWPVECEAEKLNNSGRCKNKSNDKCIRCSRNINIFDEWKDDDFYHQIIE